MWQVLPHKIVWGVICFAYQKRRVEKSYNSERFFNSLNPGGFCIKPRAFGRLKLLVRNNSRFKFVVLVLFLSSCNFLKMLFFFAILLFFVQQNLVRWFICHFLFENHHDSIMTQCQVTLVFIYHSFSPMMKPSSRS